MPATLTYSGRKPIDAASYPGESALASWVGLANGEAGSPVSYGAYSDRSIQFGGTFGAGGTIVLEGSNDGVNYVTLTDPQGNAISKTAAGIETIEEPTVLVRPRVTAGDGTTLLNAYLFMRG